MLNYRIPLIKPYISERAKTLVNEVLDSGFLTEGPFTRRFEEAVARYTGVPRAVAFTSCTTGLETALRVAGVRPGDEVIVPDFTYPATANAVQLTGAVPVIADIDPATMLIDEDAVEEVISPATRAIVPVSLFGNPLDYDRLKTIKAKYGVLIIEDAACALGSAYRDVPTGVHADMTVFSFHPRKFVTTGEGGMVTTSSREWSEALHRYKHFGLGRRPGEKESQFLAPGTNYKMSDVLAALGIAQMEEIDMLLEERRRLAFRYDQLLAEDRNIRIPQTTRHGRHSYQSYAVWVANRDEVMKKMRKEGIEVQIGTYSLHRQPAFQEGRARFRGQYPGSLKAFTETLVLPLYHGMTDAHQTEVVKKLKVCVA
ncbi:MAG: DegT/DnrJ/EryC1/StrS family aminotransferase [Marinilabilia sp.]